MKEYEIFKDLKVPINSKIIIRLDGRGFHNISKKLKLKKPYDEKFTKSMVKTSAIFFKEFSPDFVYTFSDEINILISKIPFSGRIEKIDSIFASLASSGLTINLNKINNISNNTNNNNTNNNNTNSNNIINNIYNDKNNRNNKCINKNNNNKNYNNQNKINTNTNYAISFDSRVILIPNEKITDYFKWRQDEAFRNHVNGYGYWTLRKKFSKEKAYEKLKGMKQSEIHELLFKTEKINLNDYPLWQKRGIGLYKNEEKELIFDTKLPIFNKDFFNSKIIKY
ncbi:MAG: guanylyltransferase [Methanobrevibacter sp.]|jgi:tRNA(His) 5'-end guanylyltransferase|nr:guanylyltransferase [Candidatus Methanoflexus mossambicus]